MKILVTGSREWRNADIIHRALRLAIGDEPLWNVRLIHGAARGADQMAEIEAQRLGGIRIDRYPANWTRDGYQAGFVRNALMLEKNPDIVLAFKSNFDRSLSRGGTEHMVRLSLEAGKPVWLFDGSNRIIVTPAALAQGSVV